MFDQIKAMGALAALMKDRGRIEQSVREYREALEGMAATGSAGSGAVKVTVTGTMRVVGVFIDPVAASSLGRDQASRELGERLIADAANDALQAVQRMARDEAERRARALGLPGVGGLDALLGAGNG